MGAWGFDLFADPVSPDGSFSWYTQTPQAFVDFSEGSDEAGNPTATVYTSIGDPHNGPTIYSAAVSTVLSSAGPVEVKASVISTLTNYRDNQTLNVTPLRGFGATPIYLYADTVATMNSANLQSIPISWTTHAPSISNFQVLTKSDVVLNVAVTKQIPPVGKLKLTAVKGFPTFTPGTYQDNVGIDTIIVYANSSPWLKLQASDTVNFPQYDLWYTSSSTTVPIKYWSGTKWLDTSDVARVTGSVMNETATYDIVIPYNAISMPSLNAISAIVTNFAGISTSTSVLAVENVPTTPVVDRVTVTRDGSATPSVLGLVRYPFVPSKVLYTEDRRVPYLHCKFNQSLVTEDGDTPALSSGVSTPSSAGPFASSYGVSITGTSTMLEYSPSDINVNEGTVEFWFKPSATTDWTATAGTQRTLYDFHMKNSDSDKDRITIYFLKGASTWSVVGRVYDSFGTAVTSTYDTTRTDGGATPAAGQVNYYWYHIKFTWRVNSQDKSLVLVRVNGNFTTGQDAYRTPITFGVLPKWDTTSITAKDEVSKNQGQYTNHIIGNTYAYSGGFHGPGLYSDFRAIDAITTDQQWSATTYSGWKASSPTLNFNATSKMFNIQFSGLSADTIKVIKVRPYGIGDYTPNSMFYNTSACKPILVRGVQTPLVQYSKNVYRMRLIDSQGKFPDLTFTINPTSYTAVLDNEGIQQISSVSGRRVLSVSPPLARGRSFDWSNITRAFATELVSRAESGNSFFLIDHNQEVHFGKLNLSSFDEIVATNPSRYKVGIEFIGQGGMYDYEMG